MRENRIRSLPRGANAESHLLVAQHGACGQNGPTSASGVVKKGGSRNPEGKVWSRHLWQPGTTGCVVWNQEVGLGVRKIDLGYTGKRTRV